MNAAKYPFPAKQPRLLIDDLAAARACRDLAIMRSDKARITAYESEMQTILDHGRRLSAYG